MTIRLSAARIRADIATLGTVAAVARKYGVTARDILLRAPEAASPECVPLRVVRSRAALMHSAGMTLDEISQRTGLDQVAIVGAIRARHVRNDQIPMWEL